MTGTRVDKLPFGEMENCMKIAWKLGGIVVILFEEHVVSDEQSMEHIERKL